MPDASSFRRDAVRDRPHHCPKARRRFGLLAGGLLGLLAGIPQVGQTLFPIPDAENIWPPAFAFPGMLLAGSIGGLLGILWPIKDETPPSRRGRTIIGVLVCIPGALVITWLACFLWPGEIEPPFPIKDVLTGAERVEVYRIDGREPRPGEPLKPEVRYAKYIDGFGIIRQAHDERGDLSAELYAIISDRRSYAMGPNCFWPGVAFRAWKGKQAIDVLICFRCSNVYHGPPDERPRERGLSPMARRRFARLVKKLFPDDEAVQKLND